MQVRRVSIHGGWVGEPMNQGSRAGVPVGWPSYGVARE
jgi:hypothetical protein